MIKIFSAVFFLILFLPLRVVYSQTSILLTPLPIKKINQNTTATILHHIKNNLEEKNKNVRLTENTSDAPVAKTSGSLAEALKKAQDEQFNFQDSQAIKTIKNALSSFKTKTASLDDITKLADAYLFLAFCHKNLGNQKEMNYALDEAARLNPSLNPSKMLFPPSLISLFETAKDRIWSHGQFSQIMVESSIEGTRVYVNSEYKGRTLLRLDRYPVGEHHIFATSNGKKAYKKITLKEGNNPTVRLRPGYGKIAKSRQKISGSSSLSLKDFKKQEAWLKNSMVNEQLPKALGIAVVNSGKIVSVLYHPIGFSNSKPEILKFSSEDSSATITEQILKGLGSS